jgi:hypothetical protein
MNNKFIKTHLTGNLKKYLILGEKEDSLFEKTLFNPNQTKKI